MKKKLIPKFPSMRSVPDDSRDAFVHSPIGWIRVGFRPGAITSIEFLSAPPGSPQAKRHSLPNAWLTAILLASSGKPFESPPLFPQGTDFQKRVWEELQKIPHGETRSYGEIAAAIGKPRAARAVGAACGANPIPVLIPCHRVIARDGTPGGFSGPLAIKNSLLRNENALRKKP